MTLMRFNPTSHTLSNASWAVGEGGGRFLPALEIRKIKQTFQLSGIEFRCCNCSFISPLQLIGLISNKFDKCMLHAGFNNLASKGLFSIFKKYKSQLLMLNSIILWSCSCAMSSNKMRLSIFVSAAIRSFFRTFTFLHWNWVSVRHIGTSHLGKTISAAIAHFLYIMSERK